LRHIRNGIELPVILQDNHYDFNFQASRVPRTETVVYPGDHLLLECDYETSTRDTPTFGGLSTRDEMCLVFILYYPRTALADCRSLPALHTLTTALGIHDIYGHSFEKLVDFMKDIGAGDESAGAQDSESSLKSLLNSLTSETGYKLPNLKKRPSSAPLTEEELLKLPFYAVATPEPEVSQDLKNYRTLLIELLVKIRIKSPSNLHNKTIGEVFATKDWVKDGPEINNMLSKGEHNSLCLAHGRKPLNPYQPTRFPEFKELDKPGQECPRRNFPRQTQMSFREKLNVKPLRSSQCCLSQTKLDILSALLLYCYILLYKVL